MERGVSKNSRTDRDLRKCERKPGRRPDGGRILIFLVSQAPGRSWRSVVVWECGSVGMILQSKEPSDFPPKGSVGS